MSKSITILGSTGSIGKSTVDIIRRYPQQYQVKALTGNQNVSLLAEQAKLLNAELAVTANETKYAELKELLAGTSVCVAAGSQAVIDAAKEDADWTMSSIVGAAGLLPTMEVVKRGKTLALANKETLVTAGHIIIPLAKETGVKILPVDSEHSAIFQCLNGEDRGALHKILLTASGGPFRGKKREELQAQSKKKDKENDEKQAVPHEVGKDTYIASVHRSFEISHRVVDPLHPSDLQRLLRPCIYTHDRTTESRDKRHSHEERACK